MEVLYSGYEKGRIIPDAEPIVLSSEEQRALAIELQKATPVNVGSLQTIELTELFQSKVNTRLTKAYNTVEEYVRVIETGEIKRPAAPTGYFPSFPPEPYDGPRLWREAVLCQYVSFIVKGTVVDTVNDDYWIGKLAKWYDRKIDEGKMLPHVLGCFRLALALYDPVDKVFISLNKEGNKYIATKTMITYQDYVDVLGHWKDGRRTYTSEEIMRFEKKTMYCLFASPTVGSSWAVGNASSFYMKHQAVLTKAGVPHIPLRQFWNEFMDYTWFQIQCTISANRTQIIQSR